MKISRQIRQKVEIKIRHALATGALPYIQRHSASEHHSRPEADKGGGIDTDTGK